MKQTLFFITVSVLLTLNACTMANKSFEKDKIQTSKGELVITFFGHASLMLEFDHKIIYVDPVSNEADYSKLPKGDLVLITHHHVDHLDMKAVNQIANSGTRIICSQLCVDNGENLPNTIILRNGDSTTVDDIAINAIPAYNIVNKRPNGLPFHPKGEGNGYIITIGNKRIYIAGDTENIPEMKALKNIDIAFLPMNLPYTMTPTMVADAAKAFRPRILYPYHFGETNTAELTNLLKDEKDIEVRIRKMK